MTAQQLGGDTMKQMKHLTWVGVHNPIKRCQMKVHIFVTEDGELLGMCPEYVTNRLWSPYDIGVELDEVDEFEEVTE